MAQSPLPHLDPATMSHPPDPSLQPWMYSKNELVVAPSMHRATALHSGLVLVLGTLVLAMLASGPLVDWCNRLPPHPVSEAIIGVAYRWNEAMSAIGMTDVFEALKRFFAAIREF